MIDLSNQLLGDGQLSDDLGTALEICEQAYREGVEEIVATLRMAGQTPFDDRRSLDFEQRICALREGLSEKPEIDLRIGSGYEWVLSEDLRRRVHEFRGQPTINQTNYLLISLRSLSAPSDYEKILGGIASDGLTPIISHPECSRYLRRHPAMIGQLIKLGCLIQVDALSLSGGYSKEIELFARELLELGQVHLIATRTGPRARRMASLSQACARAGQIIGRGAARSLVKENPTAVLANTSVIEPKMIRRSLPVLEAALNH